MPQAAKRVFKKGLGGVWTGLFLALVSRRILVTQKLLTVGQRGEGQVGSRHRKSEGGAGEDVSCWVSCRGGAQHRPGPGLRVKGWRGAPLDLLSFSFPKCPSAFFPPHFQSNTRSLLRTCEMQENNPI